MLSDWFLVRYRIRGQKYENPDRAKNQWDWRIRYSTL